jgi:hypothetical protein
MDGVSLQRQNSSYPAGEDMCRNLNEQNADQRFWSIDLLSQTRSNFAVPV